MEIKTVAHARSQGDSALRVRFEALDLAAHQIDDVIGDRRLSDRGHVVYPAPTVIIECNEPFLMERFQELNDEEVIPIRLTLEELGERSRLGEVIVHRFPAPC
jgi:hypothetical protein